MLWSRFSIKIFVLCCAAVVLLGCGRSAQQYINRGNQLFNDGKYEEAELNYRNAIKKDGRSGEAYYRAALAELRLGRAGEAYQSLKTAVALSPSNADAKVQLADVSLTGYLQDPSHPVALYNSARSLSDQLLTANANSAEALRIKGGLALIDNHPADALDFYRRSLAANPKSERAQIGLAQALLKNGQAAESEQQAKAIIAAHPDYRAAYELLYAIYVGQQRYADAEALLKSRRAANPKDAGAAISLASFYYSRNQPDEGEKVLASLGAQRKEIPGVDLLVGDFHAATRHLDKALADYQTGLANDSARQTVYRERSATMLAQLGKRPEALKAIDELLAKEPKDELGRALKATILLEQGGAENINAAAALATALAQDAPANARIQMLAAQVFVAKGDLNAAAARLQQAAKADPRSLAPHMALSRLEALRKNYPASLEEADAALALNPKDPNARLLRVISLTADGSYAVAKVEAEKLADDTSHARQVEMQLGIIALRQKRYAEAQAYFQKMYKEGDPDLHPLAGLVSTYVAQNQSGRALQMMESEAKRSPGSIGTEELLAATAEAAGKPEIALAELQKLSAQNPSNAQILLQISDLQRKMGNLQAALEAVQKAQSLAPDRPGIDAIVGTVYDQMGRKAEALANYQKALAKTPDDPGLLNNVAYLLADTGGDLNQAMQLITNGLRKVPDNPNLQDTLGWVQLKRGNTSAALPIFSQITQRRPDDPTFRLHYATALLKTGDRAAAKLQLQTALAKKPPALVEGQLRDLLAQTN